jgi:hypothetical protein
MQGRDGMGCLALLPSRRELRANCAKGRLQLGAESIYDRDDGDRYAGGDQPIFNRGGARLIPEELHKQVHRRSSSLRLARIGL